MRLIETIAARRQLFVRPMATLPDLVILDVPAAFAGDRLPFGRYYPILLETEAEADELAAFLAAERTTLIPPTLFDRRPSALVTTRITLARYAPPTQGWP